MNEDQQKFLQTLQLSLDEGTFIKLSLGKPAKTSDSKKCVITLVELRGSLHGQFVFTKQSNVITKNYRQNSLVQQVEAVLGQDFLSASLFTADHDYQFIVGKKGKTRLVKSKPTQTLQETHSHNRQKTYFIDEKSPWLCHLGVTTGKGVIKPSMYSKFRQIAKFIEIVDSALKGINLSSQHPLQVVDIGAGKGYLTFALYEYLTKNQTKQPHITGIDRKADMVSLCNAAAERSRFEGLSFQCSDVEVHKTGGIDILIALHACNTATDEAIFQGISAKAELIICAPCCQHEIAPQLNLQGTDLAPLSRHGLFKQRQSDLVTDIVRTLLLESAGYSVKVIEFISSEHTAKNIMIVGTKSDKVDRGSALAQYQAFKQAFGFKTHRLGVLLTEEQE